MEGESIHVEIAGDGDPDLPAGLLSTVCLHAAQVAVTARQLLVPVREKVSGDSWWQLLWWPTAHCTICHRRRMLSACGVRLGVCGVGRTLMLLMLHDLHELVLQGTHHLLLLVHHLLHVHLALKLALLLHPSAPRAKGRQAPPRSCRPSVR